MTTTEAPVVTPYDSEVIDTAGLHIACCQKDCFLCKAPFHPECKAGENDDENDCCEACVTRRYQMMCPPARPTHQHCPFSGGRWCPK